MNFYWGDIHNHCGITYGFGSLENALKAAEGQLDFCAVTGHAMWPDIPERTEDTAFLVDFHKKGFAKLRNNWESVRETVAKAYKPHEFVTFQGYEIHSSKHGDHHIVSPSDELPLIEANSPAELVEALKPHPCIAVLHHPGYTPGYRGANWETFSSDITPVVEVFSKHGCGMSEHSPYNYLHTMGPRDSRSTAFTGLGKGHRFSFVGSTDHHAGYPGSYGDGRMAVLATEKTREAIWEAILAKRTYAVTGDKIECNFSINGAIFGSEIEAKGDKERKISLDVKACDFVEKVTIFKNLKAWAILNGEEITDTEKVATTFKIRVEMGWGNKNEGYDWGGNVAIKSGTLEAVETCFRGRSVLAPSPDMKDDPDINALDNRILNQDKNGVAWKCTTFKNPTTMHSQTAALILEIKGDMKTELKVSANGKEMMVTIAEIIRGSRTFQMKDYSSEAVVIHSAVPETHYKFSREWIDLKKENDCDIYHVEIKQVNGQCAWISPIYVLG